jgi:hypothetical protein
MFRIHHRDVLVLFQNKKILYSIPLYYPDEISGNLNYLNLTVPTDKGLPKIEYSFSHPADFFKVPIPDEHPIVTKQGKLV